MAASRAVQTDDAIGWSALRAEQYAIRRFTSRKKINQQPVPPLKQSAFVKESRTNTDKERAEKAMREAEQKFQSNDLQGAKRMVLRAQKHFPSLPGLSQMLAAFNVHIAAASKDAKGHTNWYAVLDVDPSDDIKTIKKQYKKLCLLIHPDKNLSSAAEGAFKLVVQAWEVISVNASSSKKASTGTSGSPSDSGAGDQHSSTSGARSSSRTSKSQSDPKTTGSSSARTDPKTTRSSSAGDQHSSTSGARSSSRPSSAQSDPKTAGSSSARSDPKTTWSSSSRSDPKTTRSSSTRCNHKEQAEKAMREAEQKFQSNDIEGAKRMVLTAQKLFPSLPGLPQMLAAFNVHIAAASKDAKGHTNWYAVLDVDPSDDIKTIKKQYKKLCFLTHPEKNLSSAAKGAFKLVVQAWEAISGNASSSEKASTGASGSPSDSGAGDQHSSTSGARSSSRPSSAQSDPKTTGSSSSARSDPKTTWSSSSRSDPKTTWSSSTRWNPDKSCSKAEVACPKCSRNCKSLDCGDLIIRCSYCNLFAVRGRQDSSIFLTMDEHGPGILGL